MATSSKFIKLDQNILLEWKYDSENIKSENYKVLNNINLDKRGYISETGLNKTANTIFSIDPVIKRYSKINVDDYNFLKIENYNTAPVQFDKVRLYFPTNFSFLDNSYKGLHLRVYTYGYDNKKQYDLTSYIFDDTVTDSETDITLNSEFLYDEVSWGKYIELEIPSVDAVSKQRNNDNSLIFNSINKNLTKEEGLSLTSPIFIDFAWVNSKQTIFNKTYFTLSDIVKRSISKTPEYLTLSCNVQESTNGDYFEIYGSYGNSNENLDDFIDSLISKGRSIKIEYVVSLYEENILMSTQTFSVIENFSQKILYRPIINFSNTTALISVEMKVIDLVDNSQISRLATLGLTNNIFKYGKRLSRINIDNAYKPKIYNLKSLNKTNTGIIETQIPDINLTKVNYPVITDRMKILLSSNNSNNSEYKPMGLLEIILTPFDNFLKFMIAEDIADDGNAVPYNLAKILQNSTLTLIFKSETEYIEKEIYKETDQNNYENGIVIFKIEEEDLTVIKKISKENKNFYLTIKSKNNTRTLLYSGKFSMFDDLTFLEIKNKLSSGTFNESDLGDLSKLNEAQLQEILVEPTNNILTNSNALVFLNLNSSVKIFEDYLKRINANIYLKRSGGNSTSGAYVYLILNISKALLEEIRKKDGVDEVIPLGFDLGKNKNTTNISVDDIKNRVINFNCDNTQQNT